MTDDILEQLPVELAFIEKHGTGALNDLDHAALLVALRDEIERLRRAGDQLAYWALQETIAGELIAAAKSWKAVRGE